MNNLSNYLNTYIEQLDGTWSYLISDLTNPHRTISHNANYVHKSASMIKVLILSYLCDSKFSFEEKISIDSVKRVEGGGALQEMDQDISLSLKSLASLMIVLSDNLATNLLINKLGMKNIQIYANKLGLKNTKLQRYMMDFQAAQEGHENFMSVNDYHLLLLHIYKHRQKDRFKIAWDILGRQQFRDRIPYYWSEDIIFHHKTGMLDFVEHDGGIIETDFGCYNIIIFTSNLKSNAIGGRHIGILGEYIYNYLQKNTQLQNLKE